MRTNSWNAAGQQAAPRRRAAETVAARGPASASAVRELIEPTIRGLGYELVDVQRAAQGLLRISVDTLAPAGGIGLDDCERISRQLSHLFAVEQVDYERLEVGSPGLDRPLLGPRDFVRFAGSAINVQLKELLQGRRRFQGKLLGLAGPPGAERALLQLAAAGGAPAGRGRKAAPAPVPPPLELPLAAIEKARLVPQFDFRGTLQANQPNEKTGNKE
ncbi:MAG TPA: ribosome maturation factor RimP [Burkholderiaceae bacterium]|jgi:ribosome maturation factor RimP|nr:ribosome maturation factor RimP [Burkholderiaceae bacterium]